VKYATNQLFVVSKFSSEKNGEASYARARHFEADKKFYYHQQSLEYVNNKLKELAIIDPCQASKNRTFEQIKPNSNSITKLMAGGEGFELGRSLDITCKTIFSLRILGKEIVMLYAKMR
jgi:hypothetical protein